MAQVAGYLGTITWPIPPIPAHNVANTSAVSADGYVEQLLAPTLRPGDIVIMDKLSAHKVNGIR